MGRYRGQAGGCHWPGWHSTGGCPAPQVRVTRHPSVTLVTPNHIKSPNMCSWWGTSSPGRAGQGLGDGKVPFPTFAQPWSGIIWKYTAIFNPWDTFPKILRQEFAERKKKILVMLLILQQGCSPELAAHAPAAEPCLGWKQPGRFIAPSYGNVGTTLAV